MEHLTLQLFSVTKGSRHKILLKCYFGYIYTYKKIRVLKFFSYIVVFHSLDISVFIFSVNENSVTYFIFLDLEQDMSEVDLLQLP